MGDHLPSSIRHNLVELKVIRRPQDSMVLAGRPDTHAWGVYSGAKLTITLAEDLVPATAWSVLLHEWWHHAAEEAGLLVGDSPGSERDDVLADTVAWAVLALLTGNPTLQDRMLFDLAEEGREHETPFLG